MFSCACVCMCMCVCVCMHACLPVFLFECFTVHVCMLTVCVCTTLLRFSHFCCCCCLFPFYLVWMPPKKISWVWPVLHNLNSKTFRSESGRHWLGIVRCPKKASLTEGGFSCCHFLGIIHGFCCEFHCIFNIKYSLDMLLPWVIRSTRTRNWKTFFKAGLEESKCNHYAI